MTTKARIDAAFDYLIGLCDSEDQSRFGNLSDLCSAARVLNATNSQGMSELSDEALHARLHPYASQLRGVIEEAQMLAKDLADILLAVED